MREKLKRPIRFKMVVLYDQLWHLLLLLCLIGLLQWDVCCGQRLVQIQEGPLYRVKGYPISISCNVSGFKGSPVQDFEFSVKKVKRPDISIDIISTRSTNFAYAVFSERVSKEEIKIERLSGSSVLLKINNLQEKDAGVFSCHTPSTDGTYNGIYGADTTLNVIEDTLVASYSGSSSKSMSEGNSLQLECQVSSQTFQHTHLSVTWFLHGAEDVSPRPIITLDRDLTVKPGAGFEDRYKLGLISMDKVEDTTYRLKMPQVQQSDRGKFYCQGTEWIQDPDRSWTQIAHKTTTTCNVEIDVAPDVGSFIAYMEASKEPLQEGDALEIRCSVKAQNLPGQFFSVTWLKNQKNVAQIGSSGVLTVFDDYKERENKAEMRAVKTSPMEYLLTIRSARAEDQGEYQCEVWQEDKSEDGTFTKTKKQLSSPETVHVTTKVSDLAVVMVMENNTVTEGEALKVICSVSGFKGPLSVSWQHKKDSISDIISLTQEGVMKDIGSRYQGRHVQILHSPAGRFTLEIGAATVSDSGEYKCTVSEWTTQSNGEMKKGNTQSQQKDISVYSVESLMRVVLRSRATSVAIDSPLELICSVKGPKVPLTVHWMFLPINSSTQRNIVSLHYTGEITWGADQSSYQLSIQEQHPDKSFTLRVSRVSRKQGGQYQCQADAYQKDVQKARKISNPLAVNVRKPDRKLNLSYLKSSIETTVNSDAKIECLVSRATTNTSRFTVTWLLESLMLLTMDLHAVVKFGPAAGLEMDQRIRMELRQKHNFELTIQQVMKSDSGQYRCEVEEWLQDPLGDWYSLDKKDVSTELVVNDKASDFKMNKANTQLWVKEGESLMLNCSVDSVGTDSTIRYSLTWYLNQSSNVQLLTYRYDGRLIYNSFDPKLEGRLHFSSPAIGVFQLTIHRTIQEDSGQYYCKVDQHQLDCKGQWSPKASDKSGSTNVSVHLMENKLSVQKEFRSRNITNLQAGFTMDCVIDSRSSDKSVFEVTWSKGQRGERPVIIFNASRDGTLHSAISDKDLMFRRPRATHYKLTVPNINPSDTGLYLCQVVEWIQTTTNNWRRIGEDKSGELSVHVETEDRQKEDTFTIDRTDKHLDIKEGEQFELECSLDIVKDDPTLHYSLSWVFDSPKSTSQISLLTYSYDGRLQYHLENQQLKDRLRFSRPTTGTFHLVVLNSDTADSGSYQCKVDQYMLGCESKWKQTVSAQSGSTTVNVSSIESKLHVQKENRKLNITNHQAEFTIDCVIDSWSSDKSAFGVNWFRVQNTEPEVPFFTARRDGTLHSAISDKDLVFKRPHLTYYKLTVPNISPGDMGQYYCQVEEWLLTPANTWKKVASDKSGILFVHVHVEGEAEKQTDPLGITLGITIPLICFFVFVIIMLLRREHKRSSDLKKKKECLWAENNPLSPVPGVTAGEDHS
ncbi:immunoglobulin superfamily member 3 [Myxocyprinus asiaticus]|uniref:immunoglobulin superfamily member 3 n=1 Tax=Myxocyprinus asiaticus TaxID=70543 RepID=UPI0022219BA9|nr:immunoglobulin superfamily member 3 [Myxocyprinus asiaticus]